MASLTRWLPGENKLKQHLTSTTVAGTTMATTGANGLDIGNTIFLGGTRHLWVFGDTFWVQSGAQRQSLKLLHTTVGLQVGLDLSTSTFTYGIGGSAAAPLDFIFPEARDGMPLFKYPLGGIFLDDRILLMGMFSYGNTAGNFNTSMAGAWATMITNCSGNDMTQWQKTNIPVQIGHDSFHEGPQFTPACNPVDGGDGWVYFYCFGPSAKANNPSPFPSVWAVFRIERDRVKAGDLSDPKWWDGGSGWVRDRRDARTGKMIRKRVNVLGFNAYGDQLGGVHKRGDGQWQLTLIPTGWFGATPTAGYSLAGNPAQRFATYNAFGNVPVQSGFTSPNGSNYWTMAKQANYDAFIAANPGNTTRNGEWGDFVYGAYSMPNQTWSGKGANDQLIVLSRNRSGPASLNLFSDSTSYWCETYQATP